MSARVWVYPEKRYEELGAERWQVSWEQVKVSAKRRNRMVVMNAKRKHERLGHAGDLFDCTDDQCRLARCVEVDPDSDIDYLVTNHKDQEKAREYAKKIMDSGVTAYGAVSVTRQVVDWYVEEDRVAEWADTSDREEVSA